MSMPDTEIQIESLEDNSPVQSEAIKTEPSHDQILRELNLGETKPKTESNQSMSMNSSSKLMVILAGLAIVAGVSTGFGAYKLQARSASTGTGPAGSNLQQVAGETIKVGDIFGIKDDKTFKDSAEGYLTEAGPDDEGSHLLLRAGGVSQTVHLTSSSTDLGKFVGMEIRVKGETFKGQKAGWLMDVGQVEVLKVEGEQPSER